jgi:hypothetical protein
MERKLKEHESELKTEGKSSPVKTVISWLVEADREFRVAQSMVNDTNNKL